MGTGNVLLQTRQLKAGYRSGGKHIVVPGLLPTLEIKAGQLICLLGPNGSGKSTLLRTLAGLQPTLEGVVEIGGKAHLSPPQLARQISLVLTDRVRGNNLNVYSLVALGRYPYSGWLGQLTDQDKTVIDRAIEAVGVETLRDRKLHTLSDGENQKVMLARALAQDTPLLLLDEPTAHLDLPSRIQLMQLLYQLAGQTGRGILLSTHELELALQVAHEIWLLQGDGVFHRGAPEDLVLNGAFEATFDKDGILFDKATGSFHMHQGAAKKIRLSGEGVAVFWTKRALLRQGFLVADEPAPWSVTIREDGGHSRWLLEHAEQPLWTPEQQGRIQEYHSIAGLLDALTGPGAGQA